MGGEFGAVVVLWFVQRFEIFHGGGDVLVTELGGDEADVLAFGVEEGPGEHVAQGVDGVFVGVLLGDDGGGGRGVAEAAGDAGEVAEQQAMEDVVEGGLGDVAVGVEGGDVGEVGGAGGGGGAPDVVAWLDVVGLAGGVAAVGVEVGDGGGDGWGGEWAGFVLAVTGFAGPAVGVLAGVVGVFGEAVPGHGEDFVCSPAGVGEGEEEGFVAEGGSGGFEGVEVGDDGLEGFFGDAFGV